MKKYIKLLVLLLILAGVASVFVYSGRDFKSSPSPISKVSQVLKTKLSVNEESFDVSAFIGKSALEATKNFTQVKESGTAANAFVTSINGVGADSKKREFWELVINGASAQVGAGSYIIQNGDSILWRLNTY